MTTIRYFIPEDGDSEDHPNIFLMSKPTQSGFSPRLKDVKDSFPMPGRYHFRFKTPLIPGTDREKNAVAVWMDCVDDNQHVGVWRNTIFAKVTRISMEDEEEDYDFRAAAATPANGYATTNTSGAPVSTQRMARSHSNANSVSSNSTPVAVDPVMQQSSNPSAPAPAPAATENLLGVFDEPPSSSTHSSGANFLDVSSGVGSGGPVAGGGGGGAEGSLLDMTGPTYYNSGSSANNSNHDDFLGMTSQPVQVQSMGNSAAAPTPATSSMNRNGPMPASGPMSYNGYGAGGGPSRGARPVAGGKNNAFDTFSGDNGPFGGLQWK